MTINLPPRRELPADVKERMRPDFTKQSRSTNHTPLAVAAGVALLIAGGVAVTQSITDDAQPARGRVITPSSHDVARCRAALGDENWSSTEMVVFDGRKVLVGKDSRFCELTRSRAFVAAPHAPPVQLEAGSITYRSDRIIAGVPPLGALKARAREVNANSSRASTDAVTTPDFFIAYTPIPINVTELVFDDRTVNLQAGAEPPRATSVDSFESGNGDPSATENRLARCLENAAPATPEAADGHWTPVVSTAFESDQTGLIVARRDGDESKLGVCRLTGYGGGMSIHEVNAAEPRPRLLTFGGDTQRPSIIGSTSKKARLVELTLPSRTATAYVTDGVFVAEIPNSALTNAHSGLSVTVKDEKHSILYAGTMG